MRCTRMCPLRLSGQICKKSTCNYAHELDQLRIPRCAYTQCIKRYDVDHYFIHVSESEEDYKLRTNYKQIELPPLQDPNQDDEDIEVVINVSPSNIPICCLGDNCQEKHDSNHLFIHPYESVGCYKKRTNISCIENDAPPSCDFGSKCSRRNDSSHRFIHPQESRAEFNQRINSSPSDKRFFHPSYPTIDELCCKICKCIYV